MSIRAVDLATTLQQTQHAERVNQLEQGQTRTQQHQFAQALNETEKQKRESVSETADHTDTRPIDDKSERERQRRGKRDEREQDAQQAAASLLDDDEPHIIDLRA